ncbi:MAG: rRNA pseudouridine synthase [Flavobacteriaceae bacterium]|nr:rRNA pseudouridine synthase [Flavobacteriaceae bacterium]
MKSSKNSSGGRLFDQKKSAPKTEKKVIKRGTSKTESKKDDYSPKRKIIITKKSTDSFSKEFKPKFERTKSSDSFSRTDKPKFERTKSTSNFSKDIKPRFERTKSVKPIFRTESGAPSKISKPKTVKKVSETEFRLNKYISNAGVCSRREADTYIKSGNVTVNGKVITEMGYKVQLTDVVKFDGVSLNPETKRYVLLNKPKGFITSMDDEKGRKIVTDLIRTACKERIYPVGRLDRNTTGVLLFTNDGEMAKKLTHPTSNVSKLYHVTLDKNLKIADFHKIANGFRMDDFDVIVDDISYIEGESKNQIGIKIHSGRNRIIRRIFEHFEYDVIKLDRVVFAGLTKKNIARGIWRHLTEQEVINLKMI